MRYKEVDRVESSGCNAELLLAMRNWGSLGLSGASEEPWELASGW